MITSLHIEGYRGFDRFDMNRLGRINLLVGKNNSGKTSILEAVYLLFSGGSKAAIASILWNRGERLPDMPRIRENGSESYNHVELDVRHLFTGHEFVSNASFVISASEQSGTRELVLTLINFHSSPLRPWQLRAVCTTPPLDPEDAQLSRPESQMIILSEAGGLDRVFSRSQPSSRPPAKFISINSLSSDELVTMWNAIALTPMENTVIKALQAVDPNIERIAAQVGNPVWAPIGRDGFVLKQKGLDYPIPIGSMGDGMWRMLALSIVMSQCRGGVLLVDEIDTGLHYSVLLKMWTLIYTAARELDVQVFATSHSDECIHSLAQLEINAADGEHVSVQRVEPAKKRSVSFDRDEIAAAASSEVEIR